VEWLLAAVVTYAVLLLLFGLYLLVRGLPRRLFRKNENGWL
jgi:hypothetical protein